MKLTDLFEEFFDSQYIVGRKSKNTFEVVKFKENKHPEKTDFVIQHSKNSFESQGYRKGQTNERAIQLVKRWLADNEPVGVAYSFDANKKIIQKRFMDESLNETVTFSCAVITTGDDGAKVYDHTKFSKKEMVECWVCDGKGVEKWGNEEHECDMCKGAKKIEEWVYPFKELNVTNHNSHEILRMLQVPDDNCGAVEHENLPELRRRLIKLKNSDNSHRTEEPHEEPRRHRFTQDGNVATIHHDPRVINGGRSNDQIERYIDQLLTLIDFAQKNKACLAWG